MKIFQPNTVETSDLDDLFLAHGGKDISVSTEQKVKLIQASATRNASIFNSDIGEKIFNQTYPSPTNRKYPKVQNNELIFTKRYNFISKNTAIT